MTGWTLESADPAVTLRLPVGASKTVGRAAEADFILEAPLVSRVHCRLTAKSADQLHVEDLGSTNGIIVNGQRVDRTTLKAGDTLMIGRVALTIAQQT